MVAGTALLVSGCASMKRDHVTVGSVPEDYRTNHPITLAEREFTLDLPAESGELTRGEIATIDGYLGGYDASSGNVVRIMTPAGSANEAAAQRKAAAISAAMNRMGVAAGAIVTTPYGVADTAANAPVRIAYVRMSAGTDTCGRWPADISETSENKHYANFGCSYQQNLAAQIANPSDLLGKRRVGPIDAGRRGAVLDDWQSGESNWKETIAY
ncbi:MAG: CpaD family pilus assembly lipoprotein [Phyllobacteriaceae bacterium]|nr:CpaD family pilus assembly lipoprotein [Phyllobacteriaceae bacterium]